MSDRRRGSISHRKRRRNSLAALSSRQIIAICSGVFIIAGLLFIGIMSMKFYRASAAPTNTVTAYSATSPVGEATAATIHRNLLNGLGGATPTTSYVKVVINGHSRLVFSDNFTDVKSVLEAGNITLEPGDQITPSLTTPVKESTVITIHRADTTVQTVDTPIPFNTITQQTPSLPAGVKKVKTEGVDGVMETTNLVQKAGSQIISTNAFTTWVKTVPINKVVLIGTGGSPSPPATPTPGGEPSMGTTMPVGQAQQYALQGVEARGWDSNQFTCLVKLWQRESGWNMYAMNRSSGAYGIPQALPGSKMGPGWQNDATVQINWGLKYIAARYGTPCGAWAHSNRVGWY